MLIEGLRTDSLYIPGTEIRTSQLLAAVIFIFCLVLLIVLAIKKPNIPLYHKAPVAGENKENETPLIETIKAFFVSKKNAKGEESDSNESDKSKENK